MMKLKKSLMIYREILLRPADTLFEYWGSLLENDYQTRTTKKHINF